MFGMTQQQREVGYPVPEASKHVGHAFFDHKLQSPVNNSQHPGSNTPVLALAYRPSGHAHLNSEVRDILVWKVRAVQTKFVIRRQQLGRSRARDPIWDTQIVTTFLPQACSLCNYPAYEHGLHAPALDIIAETPQ